VTAGWSVRTGDAGDVDALLALWSESAPRPGPTDDPSGIAVLLERDPDALIVAELDGRIVGSLIAGFDGWRANLYRLAVASSHRRKGIARSLVAEAERRFAEGAARRVSTLVLARDERAASFWQAAGYAHDPVMTRFVRATG
jgi:ribosomal protein S18 acetylase RimI-like enzyme